MLLKYTLELVFESHPDHTLEQERINLASEHGAITENVESILICRDYKIVKQSIVPCDTSALDASVN